MQSFLSRISAALQPTPAGRFLLDIVRAALTVIRGFRGERISLRASALTYLSIFSLVPMVTVALALVRSLGGHKLADSVYNFAYGVLAPGIRDDYARALRRFVEGASLSAAGWLSMAALLVSAGSLLKNLDTSINEIWNVRRKRPLSLRVTIYLAILVLGPVLVAVSLVGMGWLRSMLVQRFHIPGDALAGAAALVSVFGFTVLYQVTPNARVRFRSALAGGVTAGLAWELAKHVYGTTALAIFRRSPIWGSVSAVPLFLLWVYLSWLLLLFGARLAYAVQSAWARGGGWDFLSSPRGEALVAGRICAVLARAASVGSPPPGVRRLVDETYVPLDVLEPVLQSMFDGGLVRLLPGGGIEAARPLSELTLADTARVVGGAGFVVQGALQKRSACGAVEGAFDSAERAFLESLQTVRWSDLPVLEEASEQPMAKNRSVIQ